MSSGISIDEGRLKPAPASSTEAGFRPDAARPSSAPDDGFQSWHFFVLASILLATVAVFLTRRSSPENLILLSITMGAAGAVAAALYRTLIPLITADTGLSEGPITGRRRAALERDKMLVLRAIKELEFDRAMGKVSQKDFDEMASRLRQRAVTLMRQLDEGAGYGPLIEQELQRRVRLGAATELAPAAGCACGTVNDPDAVFCKKCGTRLLAV